MAERQKIKNYGKTNLSKARERPCNSESQSVRKILILGPSYRRKKDSRPMIALERYDGNLHRIVKNFFAKRQDCNIDIFILTENLTLLKGSAFISYEEPKGHSWEKYKLYTNNMSPIIKENLSILSKVLSKGIYDEILLAMGKAWRKAFDGIEDKFDLKISTLTGRGLGPQAQNLKKWLSNSCPKSDEKV